MSVKGSFTLELEIRDTEDGSQTIYSKHFQETYHSVHGAVTESTHVFIEAGFRKLINCKKTRVFEVGFGTGLNALLTCLEAGRIRMQVEYYSIELFPLDLQVINQIHYPEILKADYKVFQRMHDCEWEKEIEVTPTFRLQKHKADLVNFNIPPHLDLVYFDAFSPERQPEIWTEEIFAKIYSGMNAGGILTTYCAKGSVRRALKTSGFVTERLPGPPGKREMLRATRV